MRSRSSPRLPSRALIPLAVAALVLGVRYDAQAYGNHRDKQGEGVLVEHAQGLPDLARGKQAASEGRMADAEADLKPLAERGYVEAQIALARLYVHLGTPERVAQAIAWLRTARASSPLETEVPLGRLLVRQNDEASIDEGEKLLLAGWDQHHDPDALAGLIRIYSDDPQRDRDHRVAKLVAQAERIGTADVQGAVIDWYRSTRHETGHEEKLATLCDRWVRDVPQCYIDLARVARRQNDADRLQALVKGAGQQYDGGTVEARTLASMARTLVAAIDRDDDDDDDGDEASTPAVRISDVNEDAGELSDSAVQAQAASLPGQPCTRVDLTPAAGGATAAVDASQTNAAPAQADLANTLLDKLFAGPPEAAVAAAGVVVRYHYLAPNADLEAVLKQGVASDIPEAPLYLGELYLAGVRTRREPAQALRYLQQAADTPETALKGHYELGRLYANGYLDESRPLLAAQYLTWSARRGYAPADGALARLFFKGKGLCPNLGNAYVFARLGAREGNPSAAQLQQQLAALLPYDARIDADRLYAAELAARPTAYRIPQTMLAEAAELARRHGVEPPNLAEADAADRVSVSAGSAQDQKPGTEAAQVSATDEARTIAAPELSPVPVTQDAERTDTPHGSVDQAQLAPAAIVSSHESATSTDALSLQLSRRLTRTPDESPAPATDAPVLQLPHRASSAPALRAMLQDTKPAASDAQPHDDKSIEYDIPVQVPEAEPAAGPDPRSGDRS